MTVSQVLNHINDRNYDADITVEPVDGVWKITEMELLEEKRIDPYGKADVAKKR